MFKIKNVKTSLKIKKLSLNTVIEYLKTHNIGYIEKSNYIIIKFKYIYILFKPKSLLINHVNITKIPDLEYINKSVNVLTNEVFANLKIDIIYLKIDNITAVYNLNKSIDLLDIVLKNCEKLKIKYNKEKFPGLFIRFDQGTLIIFHSGKIISVGCKSLDNLHVLFDELHKIL